jgi:hypothetical protein
MKNILPLTSDDSARFLECANAKQGQRKLHLLGSHSMVDRRYIEYSRLEDIIDMTEIDIPDDVKESLIHCYEVKTTTIQNLIKDTYSNLYNKFSELCPYCGIGRHSTIDHYLPKKIFPEFSIYSRNLIPTCNICNQKKGERWKNSSHRLFIYFYGVDIPDEIFLRCNLHIENTRIVSANFSLQFPITTATKLQAIIQNHFHELSLLEQYNKSVNDELSTVEDIFTSFGASMSFDDKKEWILNYHAKHFSRFGKNYWRGILWGEILRMAPEINYFR